MAGDAEKLYLEIGGLFVEWEDECDIAGNPLGPIYITNVQLTHPDDPDDTDRWVDLTDHLTEGQKSALIDQILEGVFEKQSEG